MNKLTTKPTPWASEETIPWNDPEFSERMLHEHLSQAHDAASRRFEIIDQHVAFINTMLPSDRSARILDLGCGPGFYASRLAGMGHAVTGLDFSPASIAYATQQAMDAGQNINYQLQDLRYAEFGSGYDLAMLIFGEFNVFKPSEASRILNKMHAGLVEGGRLVLEPHPFSAIKLISETPPNWEALESGLFYDRPHLFLTKGFWNEGQAVSTTRYIVVDIETGSIDVHDANMQAYSDESYIELLTDNGFKDIEILPSLTGSHEGAHSHLFVLLAKK